MMNLTRRKMAFVAALSALAVLGVGNAEAAPNDAAVTTCAAMRNGNPEIKRNLPPVSYRYDRDVAKLSATAQHIPGAKVLGLFEAVRTGTVEVNWELVPLDGGTCVRISAWKINLGFKERVVNVASEYPKGTCQHSFILDHEHRHVKAAELNLAENVAPIREEAAKALDRIRPAFFPNGKGAGIQKWKVETEAWMNGILRNAVQRMVSLENEAQKRIDNPEEYARNSKACDGDIAKRIKRP
jgi:hypothetical protein